MVEKRVEYGIEHRLDEQKDYYAIICVELKGSEFDKRTIGFINGLDTDNPSVTLQEKIDILSLNKIINAIKNEYPSLDWGD